MNRGCCITVQVLGNSLDEDKETEDLSFPVALHSPLEVLKEQLEELTGISCSNQVLILLDLSDPDGNSDILLNGRDFMSLRDIGIRDGSVLTIHPLGTNAEKLHIQNKIASLKIKDKYKPKIEPNAPELHILETPVSPKEADHSYNGIIFDISVKGHRECEIVSLSLGGMLGRVRIFARNKPWKEGSGQVPPSSMHHWWAHSESISLEGWELVADKVCSASWDKKTEILLDKPVIMLPHSRQGFYCHSGLPDDLGIQYQTFSKNQIVAEDDIITVYPGLGHTGSEPFDQVNGWYKSYRGPCGNISYRSIHKGWNIAQHSLFPKELQESVKILLMCNDSLELQRSSSGGSNTSSNDIYTNLNDGNMDEFLESSNALFTLMDSTPSSASYSSSLLRTPIVECCNSSSINSNTNNLTICNLPKFVIYNILEFMHWDWFEEVTEARQRERDELKELEMDKLSSARRQVNSNIPSRMMIENLLRQMGVIVDNVETEEDFMNNYNAVSEVMEYYLSQQGRDDDDHDDHYDDDDEDEDEDDEDYIENEKDEDEFWGNNDEKEEDSFEILNSSDDDDEKEEDCNEYSSDDVSDVD